MSRITNQPKGAPVAKLTKGAALAQLVKAIGELKAVYGSVSKAIRACKAAGYETWAELKVVLEQRKIDERTMESLRNTWYFLYPVGGGGGGSNGASKKPAAQKLVDGLISKGKSKAQVLVILNAAIKYVSGLK